MDVWEELKNSHPKGYLGRLIRGQYHSQVSLWQHSTVTVLAGKHMNVAYRERYTQEYIATEAIHTQPHSRPKQKHVCLHMLTYYMSSMLEYVTRIANNIL